VPTCIQYLPCEVVRGRLRRKISVHLQRAPLVLKYCTAPKYFDLILQYDKSPETDTATQRAPGDRERRFNRLAVGAGNAVCDRRGFLRTQTDTDDIRVSQGLCD
jgi:hypothetical protein